MPVRTLKWFGEEPTTTQRACVRRCILQHSNETTDDYEIFGMLHEASSIGNVPIVYENRLFLVVYRQDFLIVLEDTSLNIKVLIDLWDCQPLSYRDLPFGMELDSWIREM